MEPISPQELLALLEESDYQEALKSPTGGVINDADLRRLLDRSDLMKRWTKRLEGKHG
jgi:hypothetical protein